MKRTIIILAAIAVLALGVWTLFKNNEEMSGDPDSGGEAQTYTLEESREIAKEWMKNECPTYVYDGENLILQEERVLEDASCEDCYEFVFSFESRHGGYGNRKGEMVTQAITPHLTALTVGEGEVAQALTDHEFNEITEEVRRGGQEAERLQPRSIDIYYYNKEEDKDEEGNIMCDADSVNPVRRVIAGEEHLREAVELLLQGKITSEEEKEGYSTEFPHQDFRLLEAELDEETGRATLTFTEVPGFTTGGSCRVDLLRSQIEKTALQFPEVEEVIIEPETLFQP